jgi:lysozyme family protein
VNLNDLIDGILHREGSDYTDHPADRGGPTRYGVTQATLAQWRGRPSIADDVRDLTENEAREIYREQYIVRPGFLGIENEAVRVLVVDCAVNHGVKEAVLMLQRAARTFTDGFFGPNTRQAVNRMTAAPLYRRLCADRVRFYGKLITRHPEQATFAHGWANRVAEFIEESP